MKSTRIGVEQTLSDDVLDQVVGGLNPQPEPPSQIAGRVTLVSSKLFLFPPSPARLVTASFGRA